MVLLLPFKGFRFFGFGSSRVGLIKIFSGSVQVIVRKPYWSRVGSGSWVLGYPTHHYAVAPFEEGHVAGGDELARVPFATL